MAPSIFPIDFPSSATGLLYCDSEVHDDVSPIDAPRRASWRPGLYLSHVPGIPKLDVRVEGVSTDPPVSRSAGGQFMYFEAIQRQGYTNNGQLFGDWIGREDKGGQGWITYHLSGNEWIEVGVRNQKAAKDFIEIPPSTSSATPVQYGTTLNDINFQAVKRIGRDFEIKGNFAYEHWKAPILSSWPANCDHYHDSTHLVSGTEGQLLVLACEPILWVGTCTFRINSRVVETYILNLPEKEMGIPDHAPNSDGSRLEESSRNSLQCCWVSALRILK